jgi:hypothetical protein
VGDFGLVKRDDHDQEANTNTCKPSSCPQHVDVRGSCLKRSTEKVDDTSDNNGYSSSESVSGLLVISRVLSLVSLEVCLQDLLIQLHRMHRQ